MPSADEPDPRLIGVTVAEIAEGLEAPVWLQLRERIGKDILVVYSVTAERRAISMLLIRHDDSFVWRVTVAKPMDISEFEAWLERSSDE